MCPCGRQALQPSAEISTLRRFVNMGNNGGKNYGLVRSGATDCKILWVCGIPEIDVCIAVRRRLARRDDKFARRWRLFCDFSGASVCRGASGARQCVEHLCVPARLCDRSHRLLEAYRAAQGAAGPILRAGAGGGISGRRGADADFGRNVRRDHPLADGVRRGDLYLRAADQPVLCGALGGLATRGAGRRGRAVGAAAGHQLLWRVL